MGATGTRDRRGGGSLARRTAAVSTLLSVIIGSAFLLLALAIDELRRSESRANHALEVLVAANRLERLAVDVETAQRGFIITGENRFLRPWYQARTEFARQAVTLERLASEDDFGQGRRAQQISDSCKSYIRDYSVPLVAVAQQDLGHARTATVTDEGRRQLDVIRSKFEQFRARENQIFAAGHNRAEDAADWALVAASVSVAGSIALILFSGGYLAVSVVRPVRRASAMAGRVAGGDLSVRMPETGPGEVGSLERSFNSMTDSLETNRDELHRAAEEHAALQRVATLVARAVSPAAVFGAVAGETGRLLGVETTVVGQFEPAGTVTVVGSWEKPGARGPALSLGSRWPIDEGTVAERVQRTGQPARVSGYAGGGAAAAWAREHGIRSSVGSPIVVEGRLWGVIVASSTGAPHPEDTEKRLLAFTELVAMAVANAESRAQLAASRARIVAAADEPAAASNATSTTGRSSG